MKIKRFLIGALLLAVVPVGTVFAQNFVKVAHGGDFLSVGGGARALGMGSAHVSLVNDVTASYWNPSGLAAITDIEIIYMHAERFNGVVGYDYGGVAVPIEGTNQVVAVNFFRQGVDGIKNTLNAWDKERDLPKADPTSYFTEFSATDMAFFLSYASSTTEYFSWGVSAKILNSRIGPFADAWGYSLDIGALYDGDFLNFGLNLMDITTLMKFWNINTNTLSQLSESFDDEIPEGQNERTPPHLKMGISTDIPIKDFDLIFASDIDFRFEDLTEYYLSVGSISMEPHIGTELSYKNTVSIRGGITNFTRNFGTDFSVSPTLGAGIYFQSLYLDYSFSSFAGVTKELGNTHRISLKVNL